MIAKTFAPFSGAKPFVIMESRLTAWRAWLAAPALPRGSTQVRVGVATAALGRSLEARRPDRDHVVRPVTQTDTWVGSKA